MEISLDKDVQQYRTLAELTPAHWQNSWVRTTDDTMLHYLRTGGEKPPLVLLHGVQSSGHMWLRTAQALATSFDVVMPDFRGHGESGRIKESISIDMLVEDTIALIRLLGLDQPCVVGHSVGADVAGRLAARYPLRALVLVDPALHNFAASMEFDVDNPPPWMAAIFKTLQALQTQPHTQRMQTGACVLPPGTPDWAEADYVSFVDGQAQFDLAMFRHTANMDYLFEAPDVITRISCPVLLLTARPMMPGVDIETGLSVFRRNLRVHQHIHFADSGHFIMFDQFDRFIETVARFLSEH